jgi:hypothetical protein
MTGSTNDLERVFFFALSRGTVLEHDEHDTYPEAPLAPLLRPPDFLFFVNIILSTISLLCRFVFFFTELSGITTRKPTLGLDTMCIEISVNYLSFF